MKFSMHTKEEALQIVKELVERFKLNENSYTSSSYDESNTRTDFIDKFFEALNWDVRNDNGFSERFREVVREDKVVINGQIKAPDYSFRLGGQKIFFVEAKKPSVNIKDDIAPAYQVRRYAYTAKLPLSILTDFEEFAVYDTKIKPNLNDKASAARIQYMRYTEYEANFEYLWNTFSKEAVQTGSFDQYCESGKNKRGTTEIDNELLSTIEKWRLDLAKNIALRNPDLNIRNLNIAVQKIIDRIIFLRIAEDKDMEELETLKAACNLPNAYESLRKVFDKANAKYNSGLFATESWIENLVIDNKVLKDIANELYYPNCPYAWVALPVEVLGNIYEKFLGSEISFKNVKNGHTVTVEEKPEIKKAGGVFYTPTYIVKYIVAQTIGKKLEHCTPENASSVTICDPACGSGSFLVGAFKYLLNWYLDQYTKSKSEENKNLKSGKLISTKNGIALSIQEKKRILTTHIFGVDIDAQAVEVTKLSLFLQMLEGEGKQEDSLFRESDMHMLPYLGDNIKCGNSLIGSDFYASQDLSLLEEEAMYKVNAFDWEKEFPEIFGKNCHADSENLRFSKGFECVIGNPPYVRIQILNDSAPESVNFYNKKYSHVITGNYDLYLLFIYKGFSLLHENGLLGFIQPHKFFQAEMGYKLRSILKETTAINQIIDFTTNQIFENATTYTCLLFLQNSQKENFKYKRFELGDNFKQLENIVFNEIGFNQLDDSNWTFHTGEREGIIQKIRKQKYLLSDITSKIFKGSSTGNDKIFLFDLIEERENTYFVQSELLDSPVEIEKPLLKKFLYGESVRRYEVPNEVKYLLFPYKKMNNKYTLILSNELKEIYPLGYKYLLSFSDILLKRKLPLTNNDFYKYSAARSLNEYEQTKIMIPDMLVTNRISLDENGEFFSGPAIHCPIFNDIVKGIDIKVFLAIFNSSLFWFFIANTSTALRGNAYRLTPEYLSPFGIPEILETQQQELANLATLMMEAVKKQQNAKSEQEKNVCKMRVEAIDAQINTKVYALYGLSAEEVAIVEGK